MAEDETQNTEETEVEETVDEPVTTESTDTAAEADVEPTTEEPVAVEPVAEEPVGEDAAAATESDEGKAGSTEEPVAAAAPPVEASPKRKKKRLPRALRPARTRPKRVPSAERQAIVRLPKPESERGRRQERQGTVVSDAMDKTIVVKVELVKAHRRYKKVVRRGVKFHAHDEGNEAKVGDIVRIVETRPLSATKRWRLVEIVEAAK
jgi:small subunit ribosomal protein S17